MMRRVVSRKKWILLIVKWVLIFVLVMSMALPVKADPVAENDQPADIVLVLDCSGTMPIYDPNGLTAEATKLFVDLLQSYNVRLSIIVFGDDYGKDAYDLGLKGTKSDHRVKLAFPLQSVTGQKDKQKAKKVIDAETKGAGEYSPVGYALQAAIEVLQKGGAEDDRAAIILLSDGQVEGQADGYDGIGEFCMEYDSIDTAISVSKASKWPIYCMELNYKPEGATGREAYERIAQHQMRERIPQGTGTEPIELKSAKQAESIFLELLNVFFPTIVTIGPVAQLNQVMTDKIPEMIAERNILFKGPTDVIEKVIVTDPSGNTAELTRNQASTTSMAVAFNDNKKEREKGNIVLKLVAPDAGDWKYKLSGESKDGKEIFTFETTLISLINVDFGLQASVESGEIASDTTVKFEAAFRYGDKVYTTSSYYDKFPCKLYVNNEPVADMVHGENGYETTYTFTKKGHYNVYARVVDDGFRNGYKQTGAFSYSIENEPPQIGEPIPDVNVNCGDTSEIIHLSKHFISPDGDPLSYTVSFDKTANIEKTLTPDGDLTLKAGSRGGTFEITATATDGSDEEPLAQHFDFIIENTNTRYTGEVTELGEGNEILLDPVTLYLPKKESDEGSEFEWNYEELFSDPDGFEPRISIWDTRNYEAVNVAPFQNEKGRGLRISARAPGTAEIYIAARDTGNPDVQITVCQRIFVKDAAQPARIMFSVIGGVVALIALALGFIFLTGRRIYGKWVLELDGIYEEDFEIASTKSGKKSKCKLNALAFDLGGEGGYGAVTLNAGNRLSRSVSLSGLNGCEVYVNGEPVTEAKALKNLDIPVGTYVTITTAEGMTATLTRQEQ